jgi:cytochrome c2
MTDASQRIVENEVRIRHGPTSKIQPPRFDHCPSAALNARAQESGAMARISKRAIVRCVVTALAALALSALVGACGASKPKSGPSTASTSTGSSLLAQGRKLYSADGCEDCHSLNGTPNTGPTWKGLYGSRVALTSGRTVTADSAYLTEHIVDPTALTVRGFPGSVMEEAIVGDGLANKPADVRALVALIESLGNRR